ncbi:Nucleolar protein 6, partial [Stegodyphus mimosarum]
MPKICSILKKGLGSRILLLDILKAAHTPWEVSEPPPSPNAGQVTVGLLLNPDVPLNNLEKGPSADDPAAKEFQSFWGSRSEMRRFQDGTIREAVYWPAITVADKRNVFFSMIKDILKRHIDAEGKDIAVVGTEVDCALHLPARIFSEFEPYGTGEEAHIKLMQSFNSLSRQLRSLQGLPLLIASMQGTSPAFRSSEVFPPLSAEYTIEKKICFISDNIMKLKENSPKAPPYVPTLKVILNLEGSGKWPNDVDALKRVKAAFYIKIAELVKSQCSLVSVPFVTHVDIFKDGYVFRLEIACHKEIYLMKQIRMPDGLFKIKETKESHDLEVSTEVLPKLNSVLHGLHQQHNTYGTACRLAKRWASAQMKHGYIHDIAIELIMACVYVHPEPYTCPCSPQVAFSRFLSLLISHDWNLNPLIVNLNHELQRKEIEEIHAEFTSQRSTLPAVVIPTPLDKRGNMWTKNAPTALILKRIRILATATLETMEKILNSPKNEDIKVIFRPPLQSYDVLIYLKRKEIPRLCQAVDVLPSDELPVYKPYQHNDDEIYPVVDYDPVQKYLEELRQNFHEFAHFLYDRYGGDFIAVVWKKSAFTPRNFTVSHVNNRTVHQDGVSIVPDVETILEDFRLLGSGLVKEIVKQTEKWKIP